MDINIKVKDKIAVGDETLIVCGNSDYTVNFELDAEWAEYDKKTMRIGYRNGKYKDVDFTGASLRAACYKKAPVDSRRPLRRTASYLDPGCVPLCRVHHRQR